MGKFFSDTVFVSLKFEDQLRQVSYLQVSALRGMLLHMAAGATGSAEQMTGELGMHSHQVRPDTQDESLEDTHSDKTGH